MSFIFTSRDPPQCVLAVMLDDLCRFRTRERHIIQPNSMHIFIMWFLRVRVIVPVSRRGLDPERVPRFDVEDCRDLCCRSAIAKPVLLQHDPYPLRRTCRPPTPAVHSKPPHRPVSDAPTGILPRPPSIGLPTPSL